MGISIRHGSDFVAINRLENVRCGRCGRQRDVNETSTRRPMTSMVNGCEWHWIVIRDGLMGWVAMKTWSSFQSWFLLKISWMTGITWSWAALIRLISLFLGQECSPHRTNRVCQKGTMVRKCRCYMKFIEVWSCLATGEPECIHVSTMKKVGCVFLALKPSEKPVIFGQDAGAAFIPQRRTRRHFRSSVQWLCSNWGGWFGGEFSWMP
jgi:hypothetical protein